MAVQYMAMSRGKEDQETDTPLNTGDHAPAGTKLCVLLFCYFNGELPPTAHNVVWFYTSMVKQCNYVYDAVQ